MTRQTMRAGTTQTGFAKLHLTTAMPSATVKNMKDGKGVAQRRGFPASITGSSGSGWPATCSPHAAPEAAGIKNAEGEDCRDRLKVR